MSMGYSPGLAGRGFNSTPAANNSLNQGTNNIGQVYQDMGQNYQRFGQAYQQATQAANQLRSATTTQQQQMNQYLQALQTALGGMSTAGQNTTNQQPMGQPGLGQPAFGRGGLPDVYGFTGFEDNPARFNAGQTLGAIGEQALNAGQQALNAGQQGILANPTVSPTGFDPITGQPTGFEPLNAGQQALINAQTQAFTGTIAPAYQQAVAGATGLYGSPSMNPQDFYNQYASALIGFPASAYTPNFQG